MQRSLAILCVAYNKIATFVGCGVFVGLLGVAYYAQVHHLVYFIMIQIFVGIFEVSASVNNFNITIM